MTQPSATTNELLLLVGKMDGKLDIILTQHANHSERIAHLEAWKNKAWGFCLAGGAAAGAITSHAPKLFQLFPGSH